MSRSVLKTYTVLFPTVAAALLLSIAGCTVQKSPLAEADKAMERQEWQTAVVYLDDYIYRHPEGKHIEQVLFLRGESFFRMKDYYQASASWVRYMDRFPDGRYAPDVLYRFQVLLAMQRAIDDQVRQMTEQALAKAEKARERLEASPDDCGAMFNLANALWELAQYEKSADYYVDAIRCDSSLASTRQVRSRIKFYPNDGYGPNIPGMDKSDIIVTQTYKYPVLDSGGVVGDGDVLSLNRREIITGKVKNVSTHRAYGVQVVVTAYDFFGHVLDVKTTNVGNMLPNEERPFKVEFAIDLGVVQDTTVDNFEVQTYYELDPEPYIPGRG